MQRAIDIVELIGAATTCASAGGWRRPVVGGGQQDVLAFADIADIAWRCPGGCAASAEASCALALATDGGIAA